MPKHTDKELDATAAHVKALAKILDAHSAEYIVRACNVFTDIEEGISLIVRKDHYYQLEAQAKSHEELLKACKALLAVQDEDSMFRLPVNLPEISNMRAAIAKATG